MKKAIIVDGNSLVYRVYWATINMLDYYKKNNLTPTNALYLFIKTIINLLKQEKYDYAFVAFDHGKKTFRSNMFDKYKSKRKPMPQELLIQLPLINEMLNTIGIYCKSMEGFEADDLIGSCTKLLNNNQIYVDIFTSDRDILQLVNQLTSVNIFKTGISKIEKYTFENFAQQFYGLYPKQVIDYKAIVGDNSDNFPGVKGIGPKTAINLLKKYGSLNEIYIHKNEINENLQQKLMDGENDGKLCYSLATIKQDLFDTSHIDIFLKKPIDISSFTQLANKYKINSLLKYINSF